MDESTSADIPQQGADSSETIANETPALTETETDLESGDATTEVEGTEVPKTDIEPTATATPLDEGDQASSSSNIEQTRLEAEIPTAGLPDPEVENWAKIFLRIHREETAERDTEITRLKTELEATQNSLTKAEEAIAQWTQDEERYKAQLKDYPGALSDDDPDALSVQSPVQYMGGAILTDVLQNPDHCRDMGILLQRRAERYATGLDGRSGCAHGLRYFSTQLTRRNSTGPRSLERSLLAGSRRKGTKYCCCSF